MLGVDGHLMGQREERHEHTSGNCVVDDEPLTAAVSSHMWAAAQGPAWLADFKQQAVLVIT